MRSTAFGARSIVQRRCHRCACTAIVTVATCYGPTTARISLAFVSLLLCSCVACLLVFAVRSARHHARGLVCLVLRPVHSVGLSPPVLRGGGLACGVGAEVGWVHEPTQNQRYGSSHFGT